MTNGPRIGTRPPLKPPPGRARTVAPVSPQRPVWPVWFGPASALLALLALTGVQTTTVIFLLFVIAASACRDAWQVLATILLTSLTLVTASFDILEQVRQPFLLRFVLASLLLLLSLLPFSGNRLPRGVVNYLRLLLPFFAVAGIGVALSDFPRIALEGVAGTAVTLGIPIAAAWNRWRRTDRLVADLAVMHRFLWLVAVVGVAIAAAGGFSGRAAGIHFNPNTFAFMCLLGFGLDLGLRQRLPYWTLPITAPVFILGVLASGSRGALLGVLLAPAYLLLRRRGRQRSARIAAGMLLGFSVLLIAPLPSPFNVQDVIDRTFGGDEVNISGRQDNWDNMIVLFRQKPTFGHGLRTTNEALGVAREIGEVDGGGGHSSYLQVLVETGAVGAVLLFGSILLVLLLPAPRERDALTAWVAASGVVVAGLGHMIGESFVLGVGSPFPFVFWTGVAVLALVGSMRPGAPRAR